MLDGILKTLGVYRPPGVPLYKVLVYYFMFMLTMLGLHKLLPVITTLNHRAVNWMAKDMPPSQAKGPKLLDLPSIPASQLDVESFQAKFLRTNTPVVIRGLGREQGWTAVGKWNFEFFRRNYPDLELAIFKDHSKKDLTFVKCKDFIDKVKAGERVYGRGLDEFFVHDPALLHEVNYPLVQQLRGADHNIGKMGSGQYEGLMFMSGQGTYTQIHSDVGTNFNMQIEGVKEWHIFSPDQLPYFYAEPCSTNLFYRSAIQDMTDPDVKTYPMFKYATGYKVELQPGDALFIPPMWWHGVKNRTDAIGCALDGFVNLGLTLKSNPFLSLGTLLNPLNVRGAFNLINKFDFIGK